MARSIHNIKQLDHPLTPTAAISGGEDTRDGSKGDLKSDNMTLFRGLYLNADYAELLLLGKHS